MALLQRSSVSSVLANRTVATHRGGRRTSTIAAATGRKPKAATTRKTAKVELDEDQIGTVGAVGIFGAAVATAGFLFVNNTYEIKSGTAPGVEVAEVVAPTPAPRAVPLPSADTGAKVKPEDKTTSAAPKTTAKAPPAKVEAAAKPAAPSSPAYKPPAAIKVEKSSVKKSSQGDTAVANVAPKAPRADGTLPKFQPPKPAPATKAASTAKATPGGGAPADATTTTSGPSSPTLLGAVVVLALGGAAVAANGTEGSAAGAPAAPLPVGAASEATMDERVKDRQAWIAAWRAKK